MAKLTLNDQGSGYQTADAYNANNALIEAAFENTLSRDGTTPNQMNSDLDMNSNDINNVGEINTAALILGGVPVTVTLHQGVLDGLDTLELLGDVIGGPESFVVDGNTQVTTLIDLPTINIISGGNAASTYPELPSGPFGPYAVPDGGATGEVLTKATAADQDVNWQAGGGGGNEVWEKALADVIPTNTEFFDITWDETKYIAIQIHFEDLRVDTDSSQLGFQLGKDNGATMFTTVGTYDYYFINGWGTPQLINNPTTSEVEIAEFLGNAISPRNEVISGRIDLHSMNAELLGASFDAHCHWIETSTDIFHRNTSGRCGQYNGPIVFGSIDTIRFKLQSGAKFIATGKVVIYGLVA